MEFPVSINVKSVNVGNDTFMYDGDTGFLTKSTGLLNDVLDYISCSTREEIVDALREKYGEEEIIGCLQNIETLYNQKKLFDREKKAVMRSPEAYQKDWEAGNLLVNLWLNVSHDCNLRCIYCFGHGGSYGGTRELMSIDTAKKSIDYWFKYLNKNIPMTTVTFFGGEPLMNLEVIKFSINYVNKLLEEYDIRVQYIITTNGTIFNDEIIELFMKNDVQFAISIDGGQAIQDRNRPYASGKGSFEIIKKNVAKLRKYYDKISARMTLTHDDVPYLKQAVMDLWDIGFTDVVYEFVTIRYPFDALKVNQAKNIATSQTENKFGYNGLGDRSDAFRHGIWNAEMTVLIGKERAELFATAHEDKDISGNEMDGYPKTAHKEMDLHNNEIGRNIGEINKNVSEGERADIIYQNINSETTEFIWLHE